MPGEQVTEVNVKCCNGYNKPYDILLATPSFWSPSKYCQFLHECIILVDELSEENKAAIDAEALSSKLWFPYSDWKTALGEKHFQIITTYKKKSRETKPTKTKNKENDNSKFSVNVQSVVSLLTFMRNKYRHRHKFPDDEKQALGWFIQNQHGAWDFSRTLFTQYFSSRYPLLIHFLWVKLVRFRTEMRIWYPQYLEYRGYPVSEQIGLDDFRSQLDDACLGQLNPGKLEARFLANSSHGSLIGVEFWNMAKDPLSTFLYENSSAVVIRHHNSHTISFFDQSESGPKMETREYSTEICNMSTNQRDRVTTTAQLFAMSAATLAADFRKHPMLDLLINRTKIVIIKTNNLPEEEKEKESTALLQVVNRLAKTLRVRLMIAPVPSEETGTNIRMRRLRGSSR